jgi:hypothetical protein
MPVLGAGDANARNWTPSQGAMARESDVVNEGRGLVVVVVVVVMFSGSQCLADG